MQAVRGSLSRVRDRALPRILSQACRDPRSPTYGCFDRNWWHYKIRDFPSAILQQGALAVWLSIEEQPREVRAGLRRFVEGSGRFWNARAIRHGAFEEYYPWEQGYPPVAFSALAVAKLVNSGAVPLETVKDGLRIAARQLQSRFEGQAANQQIAGLAALATIHRVDSGLVDAGRFEALTVRALSLQTDDGWFEEYGGPDLGYLSVTLDCLWDLYDTTGDERFRQSAARGLAFIAAFAALPWHGAAMHNSRNTDYMVPYGISRFLNEGENERQMAAQIMLAVFENADAPEHFFQAVDDRYWCHYIGHSVCRAVGVLGVADERAVSPAVVQPRVFASSGYRILHPAEDRPVVLFSGNKGGAFTACCDGASVSDFGWTVWPHGGDSFWVSHWWTDAWAVDGDAASATICGPLVRHVDRVSSPFGHLALRLLSFVLGRRIISVLKDRLIFKKQKSGPRFQRCVSVEGQAIEVVDEFEVLPGSRWERAPRSSVRHVASADSYHREDMALVRGVSMEEHVEQDANRVCIRTTYYLGREDVP